MWCVVSHIQKPRFRHRLQGRDGFVSRVRRRIGQGRRAGSIDGLRPHVVVRKLPGQASGVVIKTAEVRVHRAIRQMPLSNAGARVADTLKQLGD